MKNTMGTTITAVSPGVESSVSITSGLQWQASVPLSDNWVKFIYAKYGA